MRRISFRIASIFFVLLAVGSSLLAQTSKGFFVGDVIDPTGAVIVGANVKLTNSSTGVTRETVSASDGSFRIDAVDPGTYKVCLLYTSPSPRDRQKSRMPSSA